MSDKTCVTCGKGVRYIVTCSDREHQHAGLHQPDDTCQDYVERPDSLERIADEIEESDVDGCIDWADRIRKLAKERRDE